MRTITAIRLLLTTVLIYGIYTETGVWTTLGFINLVIFCEAGAWHLAKRN
jgi:hypothetical protein